MADADNTNTSQTNGSSNADPTKGNDQLATTLAAIQDQIREMNAKNEAAWQTMAEAAKQKAPIKEQDENLYDPKTLLAKADEAINSRMRAERAKDAMIYNLSQEYPELRSDTKLQQSVLDAQKRIPKEMQDTADGYEMAVLKAVSSAGLMPKSKRPAPIEDDVSLGARSAGRGPSGKKVKVSEKTLAISQLFGRDVTDEKVLKGLEDAANRDTYNKFR